MGEDGFPLFFKDVKTISMFDPLALALGTIEDGVIKYSYKQIVKFTGHSCPTVAGAYLLTYKALEKLYSKDELPVRGEIVVEFKDSIQNGVTGVIANVISNITGACAEGGFKGLNRNFARDSLMSFNKDINAQVRFIRTDIDKSIKLSYNPNVVAPIPRLNELMKKVLTQSTDKVEEKEFRILWQNRVKKILIDNFNNEDLIKVN